MLATFCARLALGLVLWLPLIWNHLPHPRFVRTQFLTALGLLAVAAASSWSEADMWLRGLLIAGAILAACGAIAWTLDPAPAGRLLIVVFDGTLLAALSLLEQPPPDWQHSVAPALAWVIPGVVSALLLGAAMTAMLVGHSYLISPGLAMTPLLRMLRALFAAVGLRAALSAGAWIVWTREAGERTLYSEASLWLPVRWIVGILGPVIFGAMAYSAARIRSTQSATGILYVAVVCSILGELLGLLLLRLTGLPL